MTARCLFECPLHHIDYTIHRDVASVEWGGVLHEQSSDVFYCRKCVMDSTSSKGSAT